MAVDTASEIGSLQSRSFNSISSLCRVLILKIIDDIFFREPKTAPLRSLIKANLPWFRYGVWKNY